MWWLVSDEDLYSIVTFLGLFFIALVYYKRTVPAVLYEDSRPPTLKSLPLIGSLPFMPRYETNHLWFLDKLATMGSIIGYYAMSKYAIVVQNREALSEAYIKQSRDFSKRPVFPITRRVNPRLRGILDHPFDESFKKFHQMTLSILRTFGFGDRSVMETRINAEVEELIIDLNRRRSQPICPKMAINASVTNVIASILFGRRFERDDPALQQLISHTNDFVLSAVKAMPASIFPVTRFLPSIRKNVNHLVEVHTWFLDFLRQKIEENRSGGVLDGETSFIKSFIDVDGDLEELLFILRDMIIAGSETSATTVMWAIATLADHREIQARLHREIDAVFGSCSSQGEIEADSSAGQRQWLPSLNDRTKMPYLEATILELMRFKTIVPLGLPRQTVQETVVEGYTIPAGTMVFPNLYAIHMDPTVWDDPKVFRPERF